MPYILPAALLLGLLVELALLLNGGVLVLLVLGDQIVHVGLGLSEFHFVLFDNSEKTLLPIFSD